MKVYVDGSPNQTCYVTETGKTRIDDLMVTLTNNEAEYEAVAIALICEPDATEILSDSQLIVNQLNHKWSIKNDRMRSKARSIWERTSNREIKFTWIPREENLAGKVLG